MRKYILFLMIFTLFFISCGRMDKRLIISLKGSNYSTKKTFKALVNQFHNENPDYTISIQIYDEHEFEEDLEFYLNSKYPPDVVTWIGGERMRYYARKNLLDPINDIMENKFNNKYFPLNLKIPSSMDGKIYLAPHTYYPWVIYYKKSTFQKYGITPPKTYDEFLAICEKFKQNNVNPLAIGTKELWTVTPWFDILDLRINGLDFHKSLLSNKVPINDVRVKNVFKYWAILVNNGYFTKDSSKLKNIDALDSVFFDKAGMTLTAQFIEDYAPQEIKSDLDFFRLPMIDNNVGFYEEALIEGFIVPKNALHKKEAKEFIKFVTSKKSQQYFTELSGKIPANLQVKNLDATAKKSMDIILNSKAITQFYDDQIEEEFLMAIFMGFASFMENPKEIDNILNTLEEKRNEIYSK